MALATTREDLAARLEAALEPDEQLDDWAFLIDQVIDKRRDHVPERDVAGDQPTRA